jgi:hypothetical protein
MSRVHICWEHPGVIVRQHDFENYPEGTVPHTTAPFDYLIVALVAAVSLFSSGPVDLAGTWISPALAVAGGVVLWFWSWQIGFRHRWPALLLYAVSPILVHGTQLGRPDHQSLLIVLVTFALCGEWLMATKPARAWALLTGISWAMAMWVSLYEPLILFVLAQLLLLLWRRPMNSPGQDSARNFKWLSFLVVILVAAAVERRVPSLPFVEKQLVRNWAGSIGELQHVPLLSSVWFEWGTFLLLVAPAAFLFWPKLRRIREDWSGQIETLLCLLGALFLLTLWQARWGYFLVTIFVMALPALLECMKSRLLLGAVCLISFWPVAHAWDAQLWPAERTSAERTANVTEAVQLRQLAAVMKSSESQPFLAPWWLSPELAYWSGQPGVAGSSHESLPGIVDTARFFSSTDGAEAEKIARQREVRFVLAYDADRVGQTSGQILGNPVNPAALCYTLDRTPSRAPRFLQLIEQNQAGKVYKTVNNR